MKCEGWEPLLREHIKSHQGKSFAWGENDCSLFVARWVDLVTESNHVSEWEGLYNTEQGAQSVMESKGFLFTSDITDEYLKRIPLQMAKRGDIVMIEGGCLGVCDGRRSYFFVEEKGLIPLLTSKCLLAWEV